MILPNELFNLSPRSLLRGIHGGRLEFDGQNHSGVGW